MVYDATEFTRTDLRLTGAVETYQANSVTAAIDAFVYTRRLSNGQFSHEIGPTGSVLYSGDRGWTFTRRKAG